MYKICVTCDECSVENTFKDLSISNNVDDLDRKMGIYTEIWIESEQDCSGCKATLKVGGFGVEYPMYAPKDWSNIEFENCKPINSENPVEEGIMISEEERK